MAKGYLNCRMEKGLMAKDEWSNLGLNFEEAAAGDGKQLNKLDDQSKSANKS